MPIMPAARFRLGIVAVWGLAAAILLATSWGRIGSLAMWDPDDYMRLQQVRDWIGGQAFFDVTQYRLAPPRGYAMHWSRIVDAPITGLHLFLTPLFGPALAERAAISIVPLSILGGIMAAVALATARIADRRTALTAAMLTVSTPLILFQTLPMRIDHHGWQTMMGLAALAALFDRRPGRGGLLAGCSAATWLAVSLEGLPMVAAIAALLGIRFVFDGQAHGAATRLRGFTAGLGLGSLLLFGALHGVAAWSERHCDAAGPAWFGPLLFSPLTLSALLWFAGPRGRWMRAALLILAAGAGVGLLAATAPACLGGPFVALDPLVRTVWYENVLEGLPIWRQPADNVIVLICFPFVGLAGALLARRETGSADARRNWSALLILMLCAFATSLLVQRAGALAHGYALPGGAVLLTRLLAAIGRWRRPSARVLASAAAIIGLAPIGLTSLAGFLLSMTAEETEPKPSPKPACAMPCDRLDMLNRLPPAYILSPLDIAPRALVHTHHRFAGSGYHRNVTAIHGVIAIFTAPPATARRTMRRAGMRYVLIDPAGSEVEVYSHIAPEGLMALLATGRAPAWLEPVPLPGSPLKLWRRAS